MPIIRRIKSPRQIIKDCLVYDPVRVRGIGIMHRTLPWSHWRDFTMPRSWFTLSLLAPTRSTQCSNRLRATSILCCIGRGFHSSTSSNATKVIIIWVGRLVHFLCATAAHHRGCWRIGSQCCVSTGDSDSRAVLCQSRHHHWRTLVPVGSPRSLDHCQSHPSLGCVTWPPEYSRSLHPSDRVQF